MNSIETLGSTNHSRSPLRCAAAFMGIVRTIVIALLAAMLIHAQAQTTFSRITTGPIVTDGGASWTGQWGDYDYDGYVDLFVANLNQKAFFIATMATTVSPKSQTVLP